MPTNVEMKVGVFVVSWVEYKTKPTLKTNPKNILYKIIKIQFN